MRGGTPEQSTAASFVQWPLRDIATRCKSRAAGSPTKMMMRTDHRTAAAPSLKDEPVGELNPLATRTEVFLGGACNPTTWRREIAVPLLEAARVQYYNPQVDEWYEELIQIERHAMETAKVLLNVIDDATRALVSINEAVEYIFLGHRVVLVVEDIAPGARIEGDVVSHEELAELNAARQCLRDLARKKRVPVCDSVREAVLEAIRLVREDDVAGLALETLRLHERSAVVLNAWSGRIRPQLRRSLSESSVATLSIAARCPSTARVTKRSSSTPSYSSAPQQHLIKVSSSSFSSSSGCVYLAGNANCACWRDNAAARLLQRAGVPFLTPLGDYLTFEPPQMHDAAEASTTATRVDKTSAERLNAEVRENHRSWCCAATRDALDTQLSLSFFSLCCSSSCS